MPFSDSVCEHFETSRITRELFKTSRIGREHFETSRFGRELFETSRIGRELFKCSRFFLSILYTCVRPPETFLWCKPHCVLSLPSVIRAL